MIPWTSEQIGQWEEKRAWPLLNGRLIVAKADVNKIWRGETILAPPMAARCGPVYCATT